MHEVLRNRLLRSIEALPEAQLYQALDFVEFLAAKHAREQLRQPSSVQKFGELLEDKMRGQGVTMGAIKGTMTVIGTAGKVVSGLTEAGKTVMREVEQVILPREGAAPADGRPPAPRPDIPPAP